jgi:small subunit ribosomal protein S21
MAVKVRNNNLNAALRVFKRLYSEKVFEYKERRYYEKPSETKAKAKRAAIVRERKRKNDNKLRKS